MEPAVLRIFVFGLFILGLLAIFGLVALIRLVRTSPAVDEQIKALRRQGYVKAVDVVIVCLVFVGIVAGGITTIAQWSLLPLIVSGIAVIALLLFWVVILVYRCCWFVLLARAELNQQVVNAADLVKRFQTATPQVPQ